MIFRVFKKIAHFCLLWHLFIGFFRNISKLTYIYSIYIFLIKIDIISDVIIPIGAILKIFFYHFFCHITKYDCAKFHFKSIFLSGFTQGEGRVGGTMCPPRGMIRQKYHGLDRVKFGESFSSNMLNLSDNSLAKACYELKFIHSYRFSSRVFFSWS